MLYTKQGDDGRTKKFACDQRFSKSATIAEALGGLDEANSFLGLCKVAVAKKDFDITEGFSFEQVLKTTQEDLFIIQAQVAGADKDISSEKLAQMEKIIDAIEAELPPIKSFFLAGGNEPMALLDVARTIIRRAERRVVKVSEEGEVKISVMVLAYLNRLSSLLYAMTRLYGHKSGINEESPSYK